MVEVRGTALTGEMSRKQGADWVAAISVVDADGVAVTISAATAVEFYVLDAPGGTRLLSKTLGSGITVATSIMTVTIADTDTIAQTGMLWYEAYVTVGGSRLCCGDNEFEHTKAGTA